LDKEEEKELSVFLKQSAAIGYAKTRREVMCIAQSIAKEKNVLRKDKITHGWWKKFVERQGDLSLRRGDNISNIRMDVVNESTMRHYFDLLETTLKDDNLLHSPSQIYNVDETGVPLDPKASNVIEWTGSKKV